MSYDYFDYMFVTIVIITIIIINIIYMLRLLGEAWKSLVLQLARLACELLGMESGKTMVSEAKITTGLGISTAKMGDRAMSATKSPINILLTAFKGL